ncbi:HlyD family efflux transporter periplasmic adaptor subunit [Pseudoalteromonas luteoviolacea]|uniref:efflux RND transporter periplasmic adaptor subunit n=1 Tax=Pseudoalteromonas luteoviolacea TaxID=43657 RepID=UPI001B369710|nr:HlyD family efflux transporter periplasmic adaptor subunit [Pseudoalteromonas luteoviolacea]MBQ4811421.1 HlyD family efflux transporter periplasmic adaptor subunit [Pseudoalteromonas luteoviolacea]
MNIKDSLEKNKKRALPVKGSALGVVSALLCLAFVFTDFQGESVQHQNVVFAQVQSGPLELVVSGFGHLRSKHSRFITSSRLAQVEEVLLLPGSRVTSESIIMRLSNPSLQQALMRSRLALARQTASFEALNLSQKSELLSQQGQLTLLNSELVNAQLREEAEAKLISSGIVSALDHRRSELAVQQLSERVELAKQQLEQIKALHTQRLNVERKLINELELGYQAAKEDVDKLQVRAGIDGMLMEVNIEQGQSVQIGAPLALVGSERALLADLQVPEKQASRVEIGQLGTINTFSGEVSAKVNRIDPVVREGRILVELELIGELPDNARPALSIEGKVITEKRASALSIQKPSYISEQSRSAMFVLNPDTNQLVKTQLEFGKLAGNAIEIRSGVKAGEQVVISDMSDFKHLAQITINHQ